jgi:hypothetical protein
MLLLKWFYLIHDSTLEDKGYIYWTFLPWNPLNPFFMPSIPLKKASSLNFEQPASYWYKLRLNNSYENDLETLNQPPPNRYHNARQLVSISLQNTFYQNSIKWTNKLIWIPILFGRCTNLIFASSFTRPWNILDFILAAIYSNQDVGSIWF